jgi:hypothetical protein
MPVTPLVLPVEDVDFITDASVFNEMQKPVDTLNEHMLGTTGHGATRHDDTMIDATALPETATPTQAPANQHVYNDGTYKLLSGWLGAYTGGGFVTKVAAATADLTYKALVTLLRAHSHADAATGGQLAQANTHQSADTDAAPTSLHHTLGAGANQAAAGNHTHAALYAPLTGGGTSGTWGISVTGNAATATLAAAATDLAAGSILGVAKGGTGGATQAAAQAALGVPSATGTGASGSWPIGITGNAATATTATALLAPVAYGAAIADYRPTTNASAGTVTIGAGGAYEDANGQVVGPLNAQNATMPAQPSGTNVQYVGLSLSPTTGAPVATAGAVAASLGAATPPLLPTANRPVGMVIWRGATTLPGGVIAAADITPILPGGGGGSGAGGGVDLTGVPFLTNGPSALLSAEWDVTNAAAALAIQPALLRPVATDAALGDVLANFIPADTLSRLAKTGTAQITLAAGTNPQGASSPYAAIVAGRQRKITAPVVATASGAAGVRYAVLDLSAAVGPGLALLSPMPATLAGLSSFQAAIAAYRFDGTALWDDVVDLTLLANLPSSAVTNVTFAATNGGNDTVLGSAAASAARPANMGSVTFNLPTQMNALILSKAGGFHTGVASGEFFLIEIGLGLNGATPTPITDTSSRIVIGESGYGTTASNGTTYFRTGNFAYVVLTPGQWTMTQMLSYAGASSTASVTLTSRETRAFITKG